MNNSAKCSTNPRLQQRFDELWTRCQSGNLLSPVKPPWQELVHHYSEPHRFYHTLAHIAYCLEQFDLASAKIADPDAVEMALWFHDIIHTPASADNEQMSKVLFAELGQGYFEPAFVSRVGELIMVTTHRSPPSCPDAGYICDIDLASLGAPWEIFLSDSRALRLEQSHCPEERYYWGKLCFFKSLLERQRIFYTDYFRKKFEEMARKNILQYRKRIESEFAFNHG
ncbi:MAG: hypothetical protein EP334_02240 [Gammaproteobacteria bacterium]|nr:MAG: hypothetical protein EP334_02240 [Gammaproteobacteria bacterium]